MITQVRSSDNCTVRLLCWGFRFSLHFFDGKIAKSAVLFLLAKIIEPPLKSIGMLGFISVCFKMDLA